MFSRWKLELETSANFAATRAGNLRWIGIQRRFFSSKCVMGNTLDTRNTLHFYSQLHFQQQ